jgi:CheY-like chemotaxis protein
MARILVADDAAFLRILICRSLDGHETIEAGTGDEALALISKLRPEIAILDWLMPGLSGIEVCQAVRDDPALAETRIIVMTARGGFDSELEARSAGVDYFIQKPIMPGQMTRLVRRLLARKPSPAVTEAAGSGAEHAEATSAEHAEATSVEHAGATSVEHAGATSVQHAQA